MDKESAAYLLYLEDWDQKRIAKTVGVTEQTVSGWKKKYGWENKKTRNAIGRQTAEDTLWELIHYQLRQLKRIKDEWEKDSEARLIDKGDIDALQKMFSAVKGKEPEWINYVKILKELGAFLQGQNLDLAKRVIDLMDTFLDNKRKELL
jgi:hypothetical protein